jgi:hypothetical protein
MMVCNRNRTRDRGRRPSCTRPAVKFYRNVVNGDMFATCQKCLKKRDVGGKYARVSEAEFVVRSVMES